MFKYILFDLDGTLSDPKEGICKSVQFALKKANIDEANIDKLEPFIGPPLLYSFKTFYGMDDDDAQLAVVNYRERFGSIGLYENKLYDGIDDMLATLKSTGVRLAVASSKPEVYVKKILKYFRIKRYFDVVVGSELDGRRSEKSEVVCEALRQLYGLNENADIKSYLLENETIRRETAMVGDRKYDITGAKEFGIHAIGVKFGYAQKGELENAGADYIAANVEALGEYLKSGPAIKKKTIKTADSKSSFLKAVNVIIPLIWYYFIMMLVTFVSLLVTNSINRSGNFDRIMWLSNNSTLVSGIIQAFALTLTGFVLFMLFRKTDKINVIYKNDIWLYFLAGGTLAVALNIILPQIVASINSATVQNALKYEASDMLKNLPIGLGLLIFVILSPIVEELLFRWLIYGRMQQMLNARICIFVSALFFGFYHGNLLQGIYAFIMGMVMATLYEWSGSILASFVFHLGANATVYLLRFADGSVADVIGKISFNIILLVFGVILLVVSYFRRNIWK